MTALLSATGRSHDHDVRSTANGYRCRTDGATLGRVGRLTPPGCFASGATVGELVEAVEEAVALYLVPADGEPAASVATKLAGFELSLESDRPLRAA